MNKVKTILKNIANFIKWGFIILLITYSIGLLYHFVRSQKSNDFNFKAKMMPYEAVATRHNDTLMIKIYDNGEEEDEK